MAGHIVNDIQDISKHCLQIFYGCVHRAMENAPKQPIYLYQLDVKWKMFHEDPYRGESKNDEISRLEYCRSAHGDDLMVVFGEEFIKGWMQ